MSNEANPYDEKGDLDVSKLMKTMDSSELMEQYRKRIEEENSNFVLPFMIFACGGCLFVAIVLYFHCRLVKSMTEHRKLHKVRVRVRKAKKEKKEKKKKEKKEKKEKKKKEKEKKASSASKSSKSTHSKERKKKDKKGNKDKKGKKND